MPEQQDDYSAILDESKEQEDEYIESIMLLMSDLVLQAGVVAWQSVVCERIPIGETVGDGENERVGELCCGFTEAKDRWHWLWGQTRFDCREFAVLAGVKQHEVDNLFRRLVGLRLIYPDGTISERARAFLRNYILQNMPKMPKPKAK